MRQPASSTLHNRLQLPGVSECVLNDGAACAQNIPFVGQQVLLLLWEVYPSILDDPAPVLREVDNGTLRVQEEEVLCI